MGDPHTRPKAEELGRKGEREKVRLRFRARMQQLEKVGGFSNRDSK
jgi:hypothetical protein